MKNEIIPVYLFVYLVGVFLAAVSQVLLKKAAQRPHKNLIEDRLACYFGLRHFCGLYPFEHCGLQRDPFEPRPGAGGDQLCVCHLFWRGDF